MSSLPVQLLVDDEQVLLRESKAGDRYSFAILYSRFYDRLLGMCLKKLGSRAAAEDAVQETFTRAYAAFSDFDMRRPLWPWLAAIAENYCVDLYRRNGKSSLVEDVDDLQGTVKPDVALRDPTGNAVVEAERWDELARALEGLPPRQKRALLLFALEGWNYDDIASAEQTTVSSIKSLIWRARNYLRAVYEGPVLGALVAPVLLLRRKARAGASRAQTVLNAEMLAGAGGAFMQAALALMLVIPAQSVAPTDRTVMVAGSIAAGGRFDASHPTVQDGGRVATGSYERRAPADIKDPDKFLKQNILDPTDGATPEDTHFTSIVASPNFRNDRKVFAGGFVGSVGGPKAVLFVTRDAGASWKRLEAEGFQDGTIMLPPNYPTDDRIFVMGVDGLRVSEDGGATFDLLLPARGTATMSPDANNADQRVLIGGSTVMEYRTGSGVINPVNVPVHSTADATIAIPEDSAGRSVLVVGTETPMAQMPFTVSTVHRCDGSRCTSTELAGSIGAPLVRLSPTFMEDGVAFALASHDLYLSTDGARTFDPLPLPKGVYGLDDLALISSGSTSGYELVATGSKLPHRDGAVYRSRDLGRTWESMPVRLQSFFTGTSAIAALPDRLIIGSALAGVACSGDGGSTWSARCPATR